MERSVFPTAAAAATAHASKDTVSVKVHASSIFAQYLTA